jgi:hypothetical protein
MVKKSQVTNSTDNNKKHAYSYLVKYNGLFASIFLSSLEIFFNGSRKFLDPVDFLGSLFKITPILK